MEMYKYNVTLEEKPIFWLGDRFYKIEKPIKNPIDNKNVKMVTYSSRCPSCNDTKNISYKGYDGKMYETECPLCKGVYNHGYANKIDLYNWEVHEYIVYEISARGTEHISKYKKEPILNYVSMTAFYKYGRCDSEYLRISVPRSKNWIDTSMNILLEDINGNNFNADKYTFTQKKDAINVLKAIKEKDCRMLEEFNKKFGTTYKYPFPLN